MSSGAEYAREKEAPSSNMLLMVPDGLRLAGIVDCGQTAPWPALTRRNRAQRANAAGVELLAPPGGVGRCRQGRIRVGLMVSGDVVRRQD
eukprot:1996097-Rhodomonas_salina.1